MLHNVKGKVAVSGYKCDLMDELYGDWKVIAAPQKVCHSTKGLRTEVLWINYDINTLSQKTVKSQKVETECQHQQLSLMRVEGAVAVVISQNDSEQTLSKLTPDLSQSLKSSLQP